MYFGLKDITIKFGDRLIVDNITLEFPKGKIVTIIGRNGCGKSSILKIFTRAVNSFKGGAGILDDTNILDYKPSSLAKRLAVLPQIHEAPPDIDVFTLVSYGRFPHKKFARGLTDDDKQIINKSIELTGLCGMENSKLNTLSGGERQRAWIAMTICQQPEILVLDEPTTYLDINYQVEVLSLIKKLNIDLGMTIVMVLHDINLAARYSDQIYTIKDSKIYKCGSPGEVITCETIRDVFSVESHIGYDEHYKCPYFLPRETVNCKNKFHK